jgi:hypothetical protein
VNRRAIAALGVLLVGLMIALPGCGGSDDESTAKGSGLYPAEIENNFLDSCERTAKAAAGSSIDFGSYCACTLNHIEARETLAQFKADEQRLGKTVQTPPVFRRAILACRQKLSKD